MQVQVELWQFITGIASVIGAFGLMVWAFGMTLVKQFKLQLDHRFTSIQTDLTRRASEDAEVAKQLRQFEKEFLMFQRDMPIQYVRREDYIRGQTVIESKLDALYSKLELVQIQGARHD